MANKKPLKLSETHACAQQFESGDTIDAAFLQKQMSITSDGSGLKLDGDSATPGNTKLYGTDGSGVKGWYAQPSGGGGGSSDALGTGFTSGGGSGTIPDETVVDIPHLSYATKIVASDDYIVTDDEFGFVGFYGENTSTGEKSQFGFQDEDGTPVSVFYSRNSGGDFSLMQFSPSGLTVTTASRISISSNTGNCSLGASGKAFYIDSDVFECQTNSGAFIPPKLTTTQRDALSPSEGWTIYNTTVHKLQVYDGTTWQNCW